MLYYIPLGIFHFEAAMILRNSNLISSKCQVQKCGFQLRRRRQNIWKKLTKFGWQIYFNVLIYPLPKKMYYFELGIVPIRYIIKIRKHLYLKYILKQSEESLLHKGASPLKLTGGVCNNKKVSRASSWITFGQGAQKWIIWAYF